MKFDCNYNQKIHNKESQIIKIKMFKIFLNQLRFCTSTTNYEQYLSSHIKKSLQILTTPGKLKCKRTCEHYFQSIVSKPEQQQLLKARINMVFSAAFQLQNFDEQRELVCQMISNKQINSQSELDRTVKFLFKEIKWNSKIGLQQLSVFLQQLKLKESQFVQRLRQDSQQSKEQFLTKNSNFLCKKYRELFPQVDSKAIFNEISDIIKNNQFQIQKSSCQRASAPIEQNKFWDKIKNIKPRLIKEELNTPQLYEQHKRITHQKPRFRFPPQPNGYLHIGHIKSIRMNFETARRLNGQCYLRYDDTNPQKETHQFIEEIQSNVKWLGYTPHKINFTSDYFDQMIYFANRLVKQGQAYVCQSPQQDIQLERKERRVNPYRLRQKAFSQKIFPYLSPTQTLRLKLDPASPNPTLRDPIIYRFKHQPHPKTGTKFTIYPMYDFAHCLSDSLEHIDYSLCSLQFEVRRQLYYKILDILRLYKPIVWQFSRLNVKGNLISKRKIKQLIDQKKIEGWDDPRLLTIKGMQRRGYTPHMLNEFIDKVNSSRNGNEKYVRFEVLEKQMRKQLIKKSKKIVALKHPFAVSVSARSQNWQSSPACKVIYVEKEEIQKLSRSPEVILKQAGVYTISKKSSQQIVLCQSPKAVQELKKNSEKVPILSWLPQNYIKKKVVYFDTLLDENEQFNPRSRVQAEVTVSAEIQKQFEDSSPDTIFLFQRIGYFKKDSKTQELICCTRI